MRDNKRYFSVKAKTYIFIIVTVLSVAFATVFISFSLSVGQLDCYYKQFASDNARNAAFYVDSDGYTNIYTLADVFCMERSI